jgi:O-methyltransferase
MKLVTLKISNSPVIAFCKSLCPPAIWNFFYKKLIVSDIPSAEAYLPHYAPWMEADFLLQVKNVHAFTGLSAEKLYILSYFARITLRLEGDIAELGVWKGGSAKFIADIFRGECRTHKTFFLFDSFDGMREINSKEDRHQIGDFSDTSISVVKKLMASVDSNLAVVLKQGWIPSTFSGLEANSFAFVHIDLDLYDPITDALDFIYPRLVFGGCIVFDDYGFASCPGAKKAIDNFALRTGENILALATVQAVLIKACHK